MKFQDKIKWRLNLIKEKKQTFFPILFISLLPHKLKNKLLLKESQKILFKEVQKLGIVSEVDKRKLIFDFKIMKLIYNKNLPLLPFLRDYICLIWPYLDNKTQKDFISIKFFLESFFKKTRLTSFEEPYENKKGVSIQKGDYIIDAGAFVGMVSIFASLKTKEEGKIFAFEPVSKTRDLLKLRKI